MSGKPGMHMQPDNAETRLQPCARCGAEPGEPCRSKTGNRRNSHHALRWYAMLRAREEAKRDA